MIPKQMDFSGRPNVIRIPIVQSKIVDIFFVLYVSIFSCGRFKMAFDTIYPIHLNGIISQDEFRESITKINDALSRKIILKALAYMMPFSIVGGFIMTLIIQRDEENNYNLFEISNFIIFMFGFFSCFILAIVISALVVQFRQAFNLQKAVGNESKKYSSRWPIPCSWRLDNNGSMSRVRILLYCLFSFFWRFLYILDSHRD